MAKKQKLLFLILLGSFLFISLALVKAGSNPVAIIVAPDEIYQCQELTLNGEKSYDPDFPLGDNLRFDLQKYSWKYPTGEKEGKIITIGGGPNTETDIGGRPPTPQIFSFPVTLTVTDKNDNKTHSAEKTIKIKTPVTYQTEIKVYESDGTTEEDKAVTEKEPFFIEIKTTPTTDVPPLEYWWEKKYQYKDIRDYFDISDIESETDTYLITSKSKIKFTPKKNIFNGNTEKEFIVNLKVMAVDPCQRVLKQSPRPEEIIPITLVRNTFPFAKISCPKNKDSEHERITGERLCQVNEGEYITFSGEESLSGTYFDENMVLKGTADPPSDDPDKIKKYFFWWMKDNTKLGEKETTTPKLERTIKFDDSGENYYVYLKVTDSHNNLPPEKPFRDEPYNYTEEQKKDVIQDQIRVKVFETKDDPPKAVAKITDSQNVVLKDGVYYVVINQEITLDAKESTDDRGFDIEKPYSWEINHTSHGLEKKYETRTSTQKHKFGWPGRYNVSLTVLDDSPWGQENEHIISAEVVDSKEKLPQPPPLIFKLKVEIDPKGSGTVKSDPPGINSPTDTEENYQAGKKVTLTATPISRRSGEVVYESTFDRWEWSGDLDYEGDIKDPNIIITIKNKDISLIAHFTVSISIKPVPTLPPWKPSYTMGGKTVTYEGLVPCGGEGQPRCQLCHLFVMFDGVIRYLLFYIVFPLAALLLALGGMMFIFSAENPARIERGKSLMTATLTGIVVIFSAWLIINLFFQMIGVKSGYENWFRIDCPITEIKK